MPTAIDPDRNSPTGIPPLNVVWTITAELAFEKFVAECCRQRVGDLFKTQVAMGWQRLRKCLIFTGHISQKSSIINGSFAKNDLQLKAFYESSPPCTKITIQNHCRTDFGKKISSDRPPADASFESLFEKSRGVQAPGAWGSSSAGGLAAPLHGCIETLRWKF